MIREQPGFQGPPDCPICLKPLHQSYGCRTDRTIQFVDGEVRDPIPYGEEDRYQPFDAKPVASCDSCGVMPGEYHHPGCHNEKCPECGETYRTCRCTTDEKFRIPNEQMTEDRGDPSRR